MNCLGGGSLSLPFLHEALQMLCAVHRNVIYPIWASQGLGVDPLSLNSSDIPEVQASFEPSYWQSLADFRHSHGVAFHKPRLLEKASHHDKSLQSQEIRSRLERPTSLL